ncbi:hypothetical protein BC826DRAFT_1059767 [Russula brevipes]|nr:hypothetical protein BC826DRAFT_1059767 [Russula brevipes]
MYSFFGSCGLCPWASRPGSNGDKKDDPDARKLNDRKRAARGEAGQQLDRFDSDAIITLAFLLGSATTLGASSVYRRFFKRIKNAGWVTPDLLERKRWITGVVTSVGDADNFRFYHTPGFGWRGPFKFRRIPTTRRELKDQTIHIRMAGMDAPELSHFGNPAQPHAPEALAWLKEHVEGRRIKCQLLRRDQYVRVVALPLLPRHRWEWWTWIGPARNLSLEMIRAGWGVAYEGAGAVYGTWSKEMYLVAEAEAQAARRGMWREGTAIESPAEYKKRLRMQKAVEPDSEDAEPEPEPEQVGLLSRIFGRRKRDKTSV